jgi:hypothetical protein
MAMLSPLGRGRSARPSADAVRSAPVPRSAVRRTCTATARPVSPVAGAAGPDLKSSRSVRLLWRRPGDGSCGSVPRVASLVASPGVAPLVASPGWRLWWRRGKVWRPLRAGPQGLPASPAWHTGSRVSRPSRGPGCWQVPRCDAAVARTTTMWHRGGCRRSEGGWRAGAPAAAPATRRSPSAAAPRQDRVDGTSIRLTPGRWNMGVALSGCAVGVVMRRVGGRAGVGAG